MNWFTSLFSSGVDKVIDSVGSAVDELVTSDEERLTLKNELNRQMNEFAKEQLSHAENLEQQITDRHKADMTSDSWLSKNIRPLTLAFLTGTTVLLAYTTIFIPLDPAQIDALKSWLPLLQALLMSTYIFYFGGRTYEKVKGFVTKTNNNNKE